MYILPVHRQQNVNKVSLEIKGKESLFFDLKWFKLMNKDRKNNILGLHIFWSITDKNIQFEFYAGILRNVERC